MRKLKGLEPIVKEALENEPAARKDDFKLVLEVYKNFIPLDTPLSQALENHKLWGLPAFASIIRVRRYLQSMDQTLCDAATLEKRADAEADFKEYAKEG